MPAARWVTFKSFSGLKKRGSSAVAPPSGGAKDLHMERAFYLVAQLEAPHWGSVQGYDGAGLSGGPLHSVAYLPRQRVQGSLFPQLHAVSESLAGAGNPRLSALLDAFGETGWKFASDGYLLDADTGERVAGQRIRDAFAPPHGQVPQRGPQRKQAERWLGLLHELLADPATYEAQKAFTMGYLLRTQRKLESQVYEGVLGRVAGPLGELRVDDRSEDADWSQEADLALCVYHAHSVNAPGTARACLNRALELSSPASPQFAPVLIHTLGKKRYGRWQDTADGRNRYDRTRLAARRSGLWPPALFGANGIMPADLGPRAPRSAVVAAVVRTLKRGDRGSDVRELQLSLTALGYLAGEPDGIFGALTRRALRRLQSDHGLRVTGTATGPTRKALKTSPGQASTLQRPVPTATAGNRTDAFLRRRLRSPLYALQRDALAGYWSRCQDEPVDFGERLARTAEWFFEQGVQETGGSNRGPWVDFIRVTGGGQHRPSTYPPWCAFFVSACLRVSDWVGEYDMSYATSAAATKLYLNAPEPARVPYPHVAEVTAPRGSIFVRTRTSKAATQRDQVLRGTARKGHTGIVIERETDGTLLCVAGNSSGAGHSRVAGSGAVAMEMIGPRTEHSRQAGSRFVGLIRYTGPVSQL